MRVLIVARASYRLPASQGGTDAYALRTATYLVPQGHEVFLVGQGQPGPAFGSVHFVRVPTRVQVTSRFRVTYFLKALLLNLASVLTAVKFMRREGVRIDIIHCNSNLAVLVLTALFPGKPVVYTIHDPLFRPNAQPSLLERFIRPLNNGLLERAALRRAGHVIAVSSEIRAQVDATMGSAAKLTLLYPFSRPGGSASDAANAPRPAGPPTPYVLSVGAQTGRKRFDLLVQALGRTRVPVHLVLVGSGSDRARLVRAAEEAHVESRVTFYDHVSEGAISDLYRGAMAYAMASEREGFPATLMEAALSGTPTLYFSDSESSDLEAFQSDFFRVIHSLDVDVIAETINSICSRSMVGGMDRRRIASWASSRFPTPESVAHELGRIYADAAAAA